MIKILEALLPVLLMMGLGAFCKTRGWLKQESINGLKFLATKIILPVAIFHALSTADYSSSIFKIVLIMFCMLLISFGAGFLVKGFVKPPYRKYVPFLVSVYEGGMMAYPLYTNLCGTENLSQIAVLDIAGLLFGFSVYMSLLRAVDGSEKMGVRDICLDAVKNPAFIATVLGILCGLTGIVRGLLESSAGDLYLICESMITSPLSAIILLIVGYELKPDRALMIPCLKTLLLRMAVQAVMILGVLAAVHRFAGRNQLLDLAVLIYMSAPATFSLQTFVKTEEGSTYIATTNSLYCFISIAVYAIAAFFVR